MLQKFLSSPKLSPEIASCVMTDNLLDQDSAMKSRFDLHEGLDSPFLTPDDRDMFSRASSKHGREGLWWDSYGQLVRVSEDGLCDILEGLDSLVSPKPSCGPDSTWRRAIHQTRPIPDEKSRPQEHQCCTNIDADSDFGYLITPKGRFWLRRVSECDNELVLETYVE